MCPGPKPPPITITITATTAQPHPPGISDGKASLPPGAPNDKDFTTAVVPNQTITFVVAGDITEITSITEGPGSDIFSQDPTKQNNWTAIVGNGLGNLDTREYTICYMVPSASTVPYCQDPKLQMKK